MHQTLADVAASHNESPTTSEAHANFYLALANRNRNDWQTIELAYEQMQWAWLNVENVNLLEIYWSLIAYQDLRGLRNDQLAWSKKALILIMGTSGV